MATLILKRASASFDIKSHLPAIEIFHAAGQSARCRHTTGEGTITDSLHVPADKNFCAHTFAAFSHRPAGPLLFTPSARIEHRAQDRIFS